MTSLSNKATDLKSNILTYQQSLHYLKGNPPKHHYIRFRDAGIARSQYETSTIRNIESAFGA